MLITMVSTEENDDLLFKKYMNLAESLKLEQDIAMEAWESYQKIKPKYILEGNHLHWLACAIFVTCRQQASQMIVAKNVECSLTALLQKFDLSLQLFFDKIHNWMSMADVAESFRKKIKTLENTFTVACNIFKNFEPLFSKIFKEPNEIDIVNRNRNRKQKSSPCSSSQLFEFTWLLFVTVKGEDSSFGDDLVTSSHLLYACCDLIFKNAFLEDRRDLINPFFKGLPGNWSSRDYIIHMEAPCIIDNICDGDMITDAKYIKRYTWTDSLQKIFKQANLVGDATNFTGLLSLSNFEQNLKNLTKTYDEQLLQKGGFDERMFLVEHRRRLILKENALSNTNGNALTTQNESGDNYFSRSLTEVTRNVHDTPLTNRKYLGPREINENNLVTESQTIAKLQLLVNGRPAGPSEALQEIFAFCSSSPQATIDLVLKKLIDKFTTAMEEDNTNEKDNAMEVENAVEEDEAKKISQTIQVATQLFYRFLESILLQEQRLQSDITNLVAQEKFYECLFTCALEIVLKSFNGKKEFPWILNALDVKAFYFIRVIELIVRSKSFSLPRETVKHLNRIEEMILDSEIWKSDSIFWEELKKPGVEIPKFEDVTAPNNMIYGQKNKNDGTDKSNNPLASPGPSALETFDSPIRKMSVKPGQSLLSQNQKTNLHLLVTDADGNKKIIPFDPKFDFQIATPQQQAPPAQPAPPAEPQKPKKTGGFNIIFRKIYNLAGARLEHLCNSLDISAKDDLQCKIWTTFEHCLRNVTHILKDRHLDQLLMCSVYVICKVTDKEKNFSQIMASYKQQPQATNHIYRNVLLYRKGETDDKGQVLTEDKRDNLIQFYNAIFVKPMTNFAVKFNSKSNANSNIKLSPMPYIKNLLASPAHKVTSNLFIKKHESPGSNISTNKTYNYYFSRSASKDLKDINRAINNNSMTKKRMLSDNNMFEFVDNKRLCSNRKVQTLLEERRNQTSE